MRQEKSTLTLLVLQYLEKHTHKEISLSEEEILTIMIENIHQPSLTMQKLAQKSHTSVAKISRLSNKLGFSGYSEFKILLQQIYTKIEKTILMNQHNSQFFNFRQYLKNHINLIQNSLDNLLDYLDFQKITTLVSHIKKAKHIIIVSSGFSSVLGQYLAYRLQELGKYTLFIDSLMPEKSFIKILENNDLAITISRSAQTHILEHYLQNIHNNPLFHVMLTSNTHGKLCQYASLVLNVLDYTQQIDHNHYTPFHIKIVFLIDLIIESLIKTTGPI